MTPSLAVLLSLATSSAPATQLIVDINNNAYAPQHAVIEAADAIQWLWVNGTHSVTTAAGQIETFDSGLLGPGSSFTRALDRPGAFTYYCRAHGADAGGGRVSGMSGSVTILPTFGPALSATGSCPGVVTVDFRRGSPGGEVAILTSTTQGSTVVPAGPCAGVPTKLGALTLRGIFDLDAAGARALSPNAPAPVCMQFVQALDLDTCTLSNLAVIPW